MSETATETPAVEPRVLVIAGSDSGGGAGIQADIKTITALDAYAATAISALTAQNTLEVSDILPVPPDFLQAQITAVLNDIGADCIKTGMLHDVPAIETVAQALQTQAPHIPVVVDPVMVSQSGAELLADSAIDCLREQLLPRATLLTPNLPEAEKLLGRTLADREARIEAARELLALGPDAVLLKGGHAKGDDVLDVLADAEGVECFEAPRLPTRHTHGTGCTLASAIAAGIAQGLSVRDAVVRGRAYLHEALRTARALGQGAGPVNHRHTIRPF
ncbi:bifunctional hydroxymethylpyrimidine kinase/phosphomethylpyrimidine kinase [Alkalilimnicola ehrlichii MLHE-1]|uniref:hydroxymethylpyrimidine kinase n=1 Tax=Alkalilimnicola ehrlichii (strain ATCC BAA-1101 / DSM 17681 / MLHE-1) TaxID=187272 RepID=Q0A7N0_ALKEH|nr:bifunctional hydroxymethylpyrimidine kinase/phosphomethylpyrimidine kinase [Alkalilimnicola ehrlichii]ABI57157.1 phosphomethylpyrimidine kinase [Alkalilimnicola ehrlichii MLHE-1]